MTNKSKLLQLVERTCAKAVETEDQLAKERLKVERLSLELKTRSSQMDELQSQMDELQFKLSGARAGGVVAPVLVALGRERNFWSFGVFGVTIGCLGLFVVCLLQTRGWNMADTMDEEEHNQYAANSRAAGPDNDDNPDIVHADGNGAVIV
ncbi:hypothetical protein PR202_ga19381 [Eleusine coracana subsp. coracana]|uniref:Uncharacterized protein n=1 Tax=Eleusine coracana subsp. coracana TaxID=191504 RepID=A0AAV5CW14_ELECO|nr:hypothetical protein PR202_ga19381 [Eleusine coracana subsp. coracana]